MIEEKNYQTNSKNLSAAYGKDAKVMKDEIFFDVLFDVINDSDSLSLADLESDAQSQTITATLDDGRKFNIEIGICA